MKMKPLPPQLSETTKPAIDHFTRAISTYLTVLTHLAYLISEVKHNDTTSLLLNSTN